jgi:uncharacterized membrane protein YccC
VFLRVVRWPTPLRWQRDATAAAYRELAHAASGATHGSTLAAATALDAAQSALAPGSLFGDPALMTLRSLVNEGFRMRVQLTALLTLIERARAQSIRPLPALAQDSESILSDTAAALGATAQTITGEPGADRELSARVSAISAAAEQAAQLAGLTPGGTRELHAVGTGAPQQDPAPHLAISTQLVRRLAALAGQLRAVETLAPAAGRAGGLRSRRPHRRANSTLGRVQADLALLRANASLQSPAGRHAVRLAVVVPLASLLARELPLNRSYWMVVAAATVLRPEFGATFTRGTERAVGTSLGVALAGAISVLLHPTGGAIVIIVGLLAWAGYAVFPASFALGFSFITTVTVFFVNVISPDTLATAAARLLDTLIGGALGLIVFVLWPTWSRQPARRALASLVAAQREYLGSVLSALVHGRRAGEDEIRRRSRRARLARTTAEDTVALSLSDPATRRIDAEWSQSLLASMRRLVQAAHVLRLDVQDKRAPEPMPALGELAERLDQLLHQVQDRIESPTDSPPDTDPPDLRGAFTRFAAADRPTTADVLALVAELDEVVDAAGGLATLVGIDPADPPEREAGAHAQPRAAGLGP